MPKEYGYRRDDGSVEWLDENDELLTREFAEAVVETFAAYELIAREA